MHALSATTMTIPAAQEIFTHLLEQHAGIIRKVALAYSRNFADRQDLTQEITLQLWRAYPRYKPERVFSTWMYRIALNVAISFLRRHTHPARLTVPLAEDEVGVIDPSGEGETDDDERVALLQQIITSFAPLDRALLLLYLDDHSYREIAAILGITETNVATKLNRLKQRVRARMLKLN